MARTTYPTLASVVLLVVLLAGCGSPSESATGGASIEPTASTAPSPSAAPSIVPSPTFTPTAAASVAEELDPEALAERLRPATVRVIAEFGATAVSPEGLGAGSGIVFDLQNGYIITNAHVVEGASVVKIALADSTRTRPARVLGRAQCDDLAVLQVDNTDGLAAAPLGDSSAARVGASVVALGYPLSFDLGNDLSVNVGNISQLQAQLGKFQDLIKVDAAINHGNSGGPLVNTRGEVVGINTLGFESAQNQNYAIAMSYARPIVEQLSQGKNRNHIGLNLAPNAYSDYFGTSDGMVVVGVASGSPAARTGIAQADLLLEVEGKAIASEEALCDVLRSRSDGEFVKVTVLRADRGELLQGEVVIGPAVGDAAPDRQLAVVGTVQGGQQATGESNAVCRQATVVGVDALAIRAEPSRSSAQLGEVPRGGVVDVLCQAPIDADGRTWIKARSGAMEGYMSTNYLQ